MNTPTALFWYSVTPSSVPYSTDSTHPSVVDLQIAVYNPAATAVACSQISFQLQVGTKRGDLTPDASSITPSPALATPWTIVAEGSGAFLAQPQAPATGIPGHQSIAFTLAGVRVDDLPGLTLIDVWEVSDRRRKGEIPITKTEPGLAITGFAANPVQVDPGDTVTLSWSTTGATAWTLSWDHDATPNLAPATSHPVKPKETTTYTLTATSDGGGYVEQHLTVTVVRVHILSFGASPGQVPKGGPVDLSWSVVDATSCAIFPGDTPVEPPPSPYRVTPDDSVNYILVAQGPGGAVSMPAPVEVMPVAIGKFSVAPSQVPPGGLLPVTFTVGTTWATGCTIEPNVGTVALSGSATDKPLQTTTYTLAADGKLPQTATQVVTVANALASLQISGAKAAPGNLSLSWVATPGSDVTLTIPGNPAAPQATTGSANFTWPWPGSVTLGVSGLGQSAHAIVTLPSELPPQADYSVTATCDYGVNAPLAGAELVWSTSTGTFSGTVTAAQPHAVSGATGSLDFTTGTVAGASLWSLQVEFDSPAGPSFGWTVS